MKIQNTTNIPDALIHQMVRFCLPEGLTLKKLRRVRVTNSRRAYCGRYMGSHILVRIGTEKKFPTMLRPYQYAQHKGRKVPLWSREEGLLYLLAHEIRHAWQGKVDRRNNVFPDGYVRNARGRFSEVDTEAFAIHKLRQWRASPVAGTGEKGK